MDRCLRLNDYYGGTPVYILLGNADAYRHGPPKWSVGAHVCALFGEFGPSTPPIVPQALATEGLFSLFGERLALRNATSALRSA